MHLKSATAPSCMDLNYQLEWNATNRVIAVPHTAFALRNFKLSEPGDSNNVVDLPLFDVTGANLDLGSASGRNRFGVRRRGGNFF